MATTIVTKNSSTASAVPTAAQLVQGELAVNVADKRLYTEDNAGAIVELGTNPSAEIVANGGIALLDNGKATFGAGDDLQIYHDGSNSYIKDGGTGSLVIDGTNITIRDETTGKTAIDVLNNTNAPLVNLRYNNATKLATTSTGIDVTGTATMDGLTTDDDVAGTSTLGRYSSGFAYSLVRPSATAIGIEIRTNAGNALAHFLNDGTTKLHHNGSSKLATTATGIDVTGTVTAEGLTLLDNEWIYAGNGGVMKIGNDGTTSILRSQGEPLSINANGVTFTGYSPYTKHMDIATNGDISFYEDTGTTPKLFWDASAESLSLSGAGGLDVTGTATVDGLTVDGAGDGVKATIGKTGGTNLNIYADTNTVYLAGSPALSTAYIIDQTNNNMQFKVNAAERMRIDSSGNVGIGTSSPSSTAGFDAKLQLESANPMLVYKETDQATKWEVGAWGGNYVVYNGTSERMRIDSSGDVLVGTSNSSQSAGIGTKIKEWGSVMVVNNSSTGGGDAFSYYSTASNNYKFWVNADGLIAAVYTSISSLSDQRFKENIRDLDDGLSKVMQLKPRKFDWLEGKGKNISNDRGFIAQEFEEVFPDLIGEWKDEAPEGEEPYKAINADLIPTLVKAIQEQQTLIESLTARIAALEE